MDILGKNETCFITQIIHSINYAIMTRHIIIIPILPSTTSAIIIVLKKLETIILSSGTALEWVMSYFELFHECGPGVGRTSEITKNNEELTIKQF